MSRSAFRYATPFLIAAKAAIQNEALRASLSEPALHIGSGNLLPARLSWTAAFAAVTVEPVVRSSLPKAQPFVVPADSEWAYSTAGVVDSRIRGSDGGENG